MFPFTFSFQGTFKPIPDVTDQPLGDLHLGRIQGFGKERPHEFCMDRKNRLEQINPFSRHEIYDNGPIQIYSYRDSSPLKVLPPNL
jgi:hypothetical protein